MFFGNKNIELERQLIKCYADGKMSCSGIPRQEAEQLAKDMLKLAKQKMKESKQDKLPLNFGNYILEQEKKDPASMRMDVKRKEGVKDDDILWFWNMNPLERCMIEVDDENSRMAAFMQHSEEGMSSESAANKIRKFIVMYGNPEDTKHTQGDDRPLPPELKDRINKWLAKYMDKEEIFKDKLKQYSTMNAFVRAEIRSGNI